MIVIGTIAHPEGPVQFMINGSTGTYQQWGAPTDLLGKTADLMSALRDAVWEQESRAAGEDDLPDTDCSLGLERDQ